MSVTIEVYRGAGDRDGGTISEPLLGSSLPAAIARGRAELDANAYPRERISLSMDGRDDLSPGDLIEVIEPEGGAHWRGMIIGVDHLWDGNTATTQIEISRPRLD